MFEYKGAKISAQALTIGQDEDISNIASLVRTDANGFILVKHIRFAEFIVGAQIEGDPPIPIVSVDDSASAVQASYAAWRNLPRTFNTLWRAELERAETPNA